ncbi:maltoporin [Candidatus Venteria ishoeyi]|uniref:Maltoporin n=1 Tax=Candidatus Venteria ishoeyi TaxID=1899563 RepID=A0A1H6FGX3_9GAMM|nr:carbohydrate porin [Candidatus Venteria ishoeyi]SEH08913.1 Maltoporin precursor [Candidatus Venteria ishoeyi]
MKLQQLIISILILMGSYIPITAYSAVQTNIGNHKIGSRGYFRLGAGTSSGDTKSCFAAPGAGSKYRLGNECENWMDVDVYDRYYLDKLKKGPYVHLETRLLFHGKDEQGIDYKGVSDFFFEVGQLNADLGNFSIWIGRRRYDRRDIHIADYFFYKMIGDGFGFDNLDLGIGQLAYVYLRDKTTPIVDNFHLHQQAHQQSHDFRLKNIKVNPDGKLTLFANYTRIADETLYATRTSDETAKQLKLSGANGWALGVTHKQTQSWGYNKFTLQYGRGSSRQAGSWPFEKEAALGLLLDEANKAALEKAATLRLTDHFLIDGKRWAIMVAGVYERREHREFDGTDQTWISFGARPMWFVSKHFRLLLEAGYDRVTDHSKDIQGSVRKFTLAGELAHQAGFWQRPVLRIYGTYATWSESFRGQVGGESYATDTEGWNLGVQAETWW